MPWRGPADPRAMPAMAMRAMGTMGSMGSMEAMEAMEMETWKIWDLIGFGLANVIDVLNMFVADHYTLIDDFMVKIGQSNHKATVWDDYAVS